MSGIVEPQTDLIPAALLRGIVTVYDPRRVILFGSRGRGDARPDSDFDVPVVLDDDAPAEALHASRQTAVRRLYDHAAFDLLAWRNRDLIGRAHIRGSFAATILREGRTVYQKPGETPVSEPDEHTERTEAARWLERADEDCRAVCAMIDLEPPLFKTAAFHVQQAAEKLIKALLILDDHEVPKTHDPSKLLALFGERAALPAALAGPLPALTDWALSGRYPDAAHEPDETAVRAALPAIDGLREHVAARLAAA